MFVVRGLGRRVEFRSPDMGAVGSCEHDEGGCHPLRSEGPASSPFFPVPFLTCRSRFPDPVAFCSVSSEHPFCPRTVGVLGRARLSRLRQKEADTSSGKPTGIEPTGGWTTMITRGGAESVGGGVAGTTAPSSSPSRTVGDLKPSP